MKRMLEKALLEHGFKLTAIGGNNPDQVSVVKSRKVREEHMKWTPKVGKVPAHP
jgi:hypothetical protein